MKTVAVINQKGGAGKTTTSVNLAAALGEFGRRVLVMDLDPQCTATRWLGGGDEFETDVLDVLVEGTGIEEAVVQTEFEGLWLAPASEMLVGAERELSKEVGSETILGEALGRCGEGWDYVFLDCPPSLGFLSVSALVGSREALVPVESSVMALSGLAALVKTIESARKRLNPGLSLGGILACRVDRRTRLAAEVLESLQKGFGDILYETRIRENVRLREAYSHSLPITIYEHASSGAEDYRAAAQEFESRQPTKTQEVL